MIRQFSDDTPRPSEPLHYSPEFIKSELTPCAMQLRAGFSQAQDFFKSLGVEHFHLLAKDIYRSVIGPQNPPFYSMGSSFHLIPTPLTIVFFNQLKLFGGEALVTERDVTLTDGRRQQQFPAVRFSLAQISEHSPPAVEIKIPLTFQMNQSWDTPLLQRLCSAAGYQGPLSLPLETGIQTRQSGALEIELSPNIVIEATRTQLSSPTANYRIHQGIPVCNGQYRVTDIQITEPNSKERERIISLLGGAVSDQLLTQSGIMTHAYQFLRTPQSVDPTELAFISKQLATFDKAAYVSYSQSATIGLREGAQRASPQLYGLRSAFEVIFRSVSDLPCKLRLSTDLLESPHPTWHDGTPIETTMHCMALTFDASPICDGPLANFPVEIAQQLGIKLDDATWNRFQRWQEAISRDGTPSEFFEFQLGGRLNFTLRKTPPQR